MYRDGDIVAESEVVQHVDGEEHQDVGKPSNQRNSSIFDEKGRAGGREVRGPCEESRDDELDEGDEEAATGFFSAKSMVSSRRVLCTDRNCIRAHLIMVSRAKT